MNRGAIPLRWLGSTVMIQVGEGNPEDEADVRPVPITDGNFQLHISSCDNPPLP